MAQISLHRADRILDSIQKALKASEPKSQVKLSIFLPDIKSEIEGAQLAVTKSLETSETLLRIRSDIRSARGRANVTSGISDLLAKKSGLDDLIALIERLPGILPPAKVEPEDEYGYRRRKKSVAIPDVLHAAATLSTAEALKARYTSAEGSVSDEIEISTVDASHAEYLRRKVVSYRRELDTVSDQLRILNMQTQIEVSDTDLDWLATEGVV